VDFEPFPGSRDVDRTDAQCRDGRPNVLGVPGRQGPSVGGRIRVLRSLASVICRRAARFSSSRAPLVGERDKMTEIISRNSVFVPGGQPSVTYVERAGLEIEHHFDRALAAPNQIVSLSGPTKSGKTVLCRRVLANREYVWMEGGQASSAKEVWDKICYELNFPSEIAVTDETEKKVEGNIGIPKFLLSAGGSHLKKESRTKTYRIDSMASAVRSLLEHKTILVIDDFHYLSPEARTEFLRNVKGPIFNGLGLVLLSVTHRQFDAIRAEMELIGRFASVEVPEWQIGDLQQIAEKGFSVLNINCPDYIISRLASEKPKQPISHAKIVLGDLLWSWC